jgi:hypothetical protein
VPCGREGEGLHLPSVPEALNRACPNMKYPAETPLPLHGLSEVSYPFHHHARGASGPKKSKFCARYQGAYWVKTESREAFAWQGAQVLSVASVPGLPSLSKCAYPQPPVAAYFFESLTIN